MSKSKLFSPFKNAGRYKHQMDLFLHNSIVLYIFVLTAFVFLLFFAATRNIHAVLLFFLVGFLTFFFSQNMIVVIFMAILISGVFYVLDLPYLGKNKFYYVEGMEDEESTDLSGGDVATTKSKSKSKEVVPANGMKPKEGDAPQKNPLDDLLGDDSQNSDSDYKNQIEKLKQQNKLLDKVKNLEAFIPLMKTVQGFTTKKDKKNKEGGEEGDGGEDEGED